MGHDDKFTGFEGYSLLTAVFLFHVFSGALPKLSAECGTAVWMAQIVATVLGAGMLFLFYLLIRMYDGKGILDISRELFGRALSKVISLILFVYFYLFCVANLTEAVNLLANNTYYRTQSIVLALAFLATIYVVAMYPVKGLGKIASFTVPVFLFSVACILIFSLDQYDPTYLYPIWGHGADTSARIGFTQLSNYDGIWAMAIFLTSYTSAKAFRRNSFFALATAGVCFILCAMCYNLAVPYQAAPFNDSGLLDLAQSIYINRFFQRFETIFIIFISVGDIVVMCIGFLAAKKSFCHLFNIHHDNQKSVIAPLLLLILCLNQLCFYYEPLGYKLNEYMRFHNAYFSLGLLLLFLIVAVIRNRGFGGRMRKATSVTLALLFCLLPLSGCGSVVEPDEEVYTVVMGYDKSDSETMRVTMKIMPEDKNSAGGSGGGAFGGQEGVKGDTIPENVFVVDAPCNIPAADLINSVVPKSISLVHVRMLVISEEMAKEDIDMLITPIVRFNEIKSSIALVICQGRAQDYVAGKTTEMIPFLPMEAEMILKKNKGTSTYLVRTLSDVHNTMMGDYGDPIVMYGGFVDPVKRELFAATDEEEELIAAGEIPLDPPEEDSGGEGGEDTGQQEDSGGDEGGDESGGGDGGEDSGGDGEEGSTMGMESGSSGEESGKRPSQMTDTPDSVGSGMAKGDPKKMTATTEEEIVQDVYWDDPTVGYLNGYLPGEIPLKTNVETQIAGMAVIRGKQMVGTLNTHETSMFMLADGSFPGAVLAIRDPYRPDFYVMLYSQTRQKSKVKSTIDENGVAHITVDAFVHAELSIVQNTAVDYKQVDEKEKLRQHAQEFLQQDIDKLVEKLQKELEADSLRLGRYVAGNFRTIEEWEAYNWREHYKDAEIKVNINLKL